MSSNSISLIGLFLALAVAGPAQAALRVGAAKVDQTGPLGPSQRGKYDHEHVFARAILVENGAARAALISYEGPEDGFDMAKTRLAVAAAIGAPLDSIIISHTHTHSPTAAPHTMFVHGFTPPSTVSADILKAVEQARARLQPAKVGYGTGNLYLNVNRDGIDPVTHLWTQGPNPDFPSDRAVGVLTFATPNGAPIAVYVNYAMHPIQGFLLGVVTGDFPEAMSRYVEKAFGDDVVVAFTQGASGDQNPLYLRLSTAAMASRAGIKVPPLGGDRKQAEDALFPIETAAANGGPPTPPADPKAIEALFRFIDGEGALFGEEVIRVIGEITDFQSDPRIAGAQATVTCPGRTRANGGSFDPKTRQGMAATYADAPPVSLHVGMLGIGTIAVATLNTEIYTRIGTRVKDASPMRNTMVVALANERLSGYIPDDASYGHETFQVLGTRFKPGCAETGITDAIVRLENDFLRAR